MPLLVKAGKIGLAADLITAFEHTGLVLTADNLLFALFRLLITYYLMSG